LIFGTEIPFSQFESVLLLIFKLSAALFCVYPAFTRAPFNVKLPIGVLLSNPFKTDLIVIIIALHFALVNTFFEISFAKCLLLTDFGV
jgi:hypothetical protein